MPEFNTRQMNVIKANDKNILCLATASSGKTATLVGRISRLISEGVDPEYIVAFTFTRQAAQEMHKRLGEKGKKMFIGTIHAYANLICQIGGLSTLEDIAKERFDDLIKKAMTINIGLYPRVDYLFVDEFQDTDLIQYNFIKAIPAVNRFYTGDERQFIYSFRNTSDKFIRELATDSNFKKYYLTQNYRNPPNILRYADGYLGSLKKISPPSIPMIEKDGFLDTHCKFTDAVEEMTWTKDWTGWVVLCRSNTEVEIAQKMLNEKDVLNVIVKRGDLDNEAMENILHENRVKIMTIHAAKGLEFPNVVVVGTAVYSEEERRICYVAATRAKEALYWCPTIKTTKGKSKNSQHKANIIFNKTNLESITF